MSYAPGAPAVVWALDIPAGAKLTLLRLWSWADHEDQREYRACTVWTKAREGLTPAQALRGTLADQTGQTERAVRQHLTKLRALGLADASGRCVTLTPGWHGCPMRGTDDTTASDTAASRRDTTAASDDTTASGRDTSASLQLNPPVPSVPLTPDITSGKPAHVAKVVSRATRAPAPVRELDPFEARLREASEAAYMLWTMSNDSEHAYRSKVRMFLAEHSEDALWRVLSAWEKARATGAAKPTANMLLRTWEGGNGAEWVKRVLAETAPKRERRMTRRQLYEAEQRSIYGEHWQPKAANS